MEQPVVVLVHGNGESGAHWHTVRTHLRAAGFERIAAIDLDPPAHGSNRDYGAQLAAFVDGLAPAPAGSAAPLAFVAHSLGVTVAREYFAHHGGAARFDRAVLIAGCNHGAPVCDTMLLADPQGRTFRQAPELHTGGAPLLTELAAAEAAGGYLDRFLTISGPHDHSFALWEHSPQLDGADNRVLTGLGHWALRDSPRALALMTAFLRGQPTDDGRVSLAMPSDPTGSWHAADGDVPVRTIDLLPDGTATLVEPGATSSGSWSVQGAARDHRLDLHLPGGTRLGILRLTADGETLGLALGPPGGPRPESMTLAPVYHRALDPAGRPSLLTGRWHAGDAGGLAALGLRTPVLTLDPDGAWSLGDADTPAACGGTWTADPHAAVDGTLRLDLSVAATASFMVRRGALWAWRVRPDGGTLLAEMPSSTVRAARPLVLDSPAVFHPSGR